MESKVNLRLLLAILLGTIIVVLIYLALPDERFVWRPTFTQDGDQPYDLSLLKMTLENSYEDSFEVIESLGEDSNALVKNESIVIYVGDYEEFDSLEAIQLRDFARNGGIVFMSSRFEHAVMRPYLEDYVEDDSRYLSIKKAKKIYPRYKNAQDSATVPYMVRTQNPRYDWVHFERLPERAAAEGYFFAIEDEFVNLVAIKEGEGKILFHTNPLVFTNYHLRNDDVFAYSNEIFESLDFNYVYWFEPSFILPNSQDPIISESPLRFILSQPSLRWAWYLILFIALCFVWNGARRKQRAIKIENLPENETALYIDTVTRFYKKTGNHMHIVRTQLKLLNRYLKNRYRLNFTQENAATYRDAEIRLGMPSEEIQVFYQTIEEASKNKNLSDQDLLEINQKIKNFYSKCP